MIVESVPDGVGVGVSVVDGVSVGVSEVGDRGVGTFEGVRVSTVGGSCGVSVVDSDGVVVLVVLGCSAVGLGIVVVRDILSVGVNRPSVVDVSFPV